MVKGPACILGTLLSYLSLISPKRIFRISFFPQLQSKVAPKSATPLCSRPSTHSCRDLGRCGRKRRRRRGPGRRRTAYCCCNSRRWGNNELPARRVCDSLVLGRRRRVCRRRRTCCAGRRCQGKGRSGVPATASPSIPSAAAEMRLWGDPLPVPVPFCRCREESGKRGSWRLGGTASSLSVVAGWLAGSR